ncbi:taperin [Sigmodon hispidus]
MAGLGRPGPGPRSAIPAWKREILERRRAKLAALSGGPGPGSSPEGQNEKLVLAESLGPLSENPFMRLESERRRGAQPAQQLLELYRRVPGVRTIRADNILIIESAPGFPPAVPPAAGIRAAEVVVYEAPQPGRVSRLLEKFDSPAAPRRRGSPERSRPGLPQLPVASASASTRAPTNRSLAPAPSVLLSQPALPISPVPVAPRAGQRSACCEPSHPNGTSGPGARRNDFLQKTGSNSFTVHPRGLPRSTVNRPLSNGPVTQQSPANPANGLSGSPASGKWKPKVESQEPSVHPPPSPGTPSATPVGLPAFPEPSSASATPNQRRWVSSATSANDSFEIRPAPKPDVEAIPVGDLQARALANLRVNSRNSFMLIPKRKAPGNHLSEGRQSEKPNGEVGWTSPSQGLRAQLLSTVDGAPALEKRPLADEMQWVAREGGCPRPATAVTDRSVRWQRSSSPPPFLPATVEAEPAEGLGVPGLAKNGQEPGRPGLPVTFIDEVDSEEEASQEAKLPSSAVGVSPKYHLPPARPGHTSELPNRGSNTFIVVPKRKPETLQEPHFSQAYGQSQQQEAEEQDADSLSGPHAVLENTLKKRYPTVHEIEVIGGYLALQKSCLIKAGSSRKKMKISFNDKSLHTTFEYPSESSLAQEEVEDEEEDGEEDGEEEEVGLDSEKPFTLFLPRATFVSSVGPETPRLPDGSSGLSSYTPKHSMAFSKWQEQTLVQAPSEVELPQKEVMLTPASQNDLSDFRSEPALYF